MRRSTSLLALLLVWFAASGANCVRNPFVMAPNVPQLLPQQPQYADLATTVNENTAKVRSLRSSQAVVAVNDGAMPISLSAMIALERPRRFRMKANMLMLGPVADAGSNDELFWFWTKTLQPQALLFCRHDQFQQSPMRNMVPLNPDWLVEGFGLVTFDPQEQHRGPTPDAQGRLRIDTLRQTPAGPVTRITLLDPRAGWVLEQHLFDAQGKQLLTALTSQHQRDEASGAYIPRKIDLISQAGGQKMSMSIQLGQLEVNSLGANDYALFQKPQYHAQGAPDLDLGNPNLQLAPGGLPSSPGGFQSSQVHPAGYPPPQPELQRPQFRFR